jgi:hypothetical protein
MIVVLMTFLSSSTSFGIYNFKLFSGHGYACSIELRRTLSPSVGSGINFRRAKSQPAIRACFCSKGAEAFLSVNKNLVRSPIRRLWTFHIAPSLSAAAVIGTLIALIHEKDINQQRTLIDYILKLAEFSVILHAFSGLLAFKVAKERNLENPLESGIKGFISGFVVLADLPDKGSNSK